VERGIAKLDGGVVGIDGRLYKLEAMEMPAEGDLSRLEGSFARIEAKTDPAGNPLDIRITIQNGVAKLENAKFRFDQLEKIDPPSTGKNVEGVEKDGVWTAEEFGRPLKLEQGPNKAVNDFVTAAKVAEGKISPKVAQLADDLPTGRTYGWDQKLKQVDSLKRKVAGKIVNQPDVTKILPYINDSVRYTIVLEDAVYVTGVESAMAKMEVLFEKVEIKNAWKQDPKDPRYKGINSTWRDRETGHLFELQIHTPSSLSAKTVEHPWYQLTRIPGLTQLEADFAKAQSAMLFAEVPTGPRFTEIPEFEWIGKPK
jgi:hypothetical protein